MEFEWDEEKRDANIAKHGIDFVRATSIWLHAIIDPAGERTVEGETRRLALGVIGEDAIVIAVVYTMRDGVRRLISARRGRRNERQYYQDQFGRGV